MLKPVSVFHPAEVTSSILLPDAVDLQAAVASEKPGVEAANALGPSGDPAVPPVLQTRLVLSPDSAVGTGCHNHQQVDDRIEYQMKKII